MTFLEKWKEEHPGSGSDWPSGCPHQHGYEEPLDYDCHNISCYTCWDREIPEEKTLNDVIEKACALNPELNKDEMQKSVHALIDDFGNKPHILDSGSKTEFSTGAVRDSREGKGRCDLLPLDVVCHYMKDAVLGYIGNFQQDGTPYELGEALHAFVEICSVHGSFKNDYDMLLETSKQYAEGAEKYGENNWKNGMPVKIYIDSAVRHYLKFLRGDNDEPHDRAFVWNLMCAIWTCKHKPELNDYAKRDISAVEEALG